MRNGRIHVRVLCLLLCLAVLLPCVSALGETTKVAAYLLRLREGPSSNAKVLDAYPRGTVVTILKKGSDWTKVRVHGKVGYMMTGLLSYGRYKTSDTENKSTAQNGTTRKTTVSVSSGETAYVMKGIRLNMRDSASSDGEIIASFRGGKKVTVLRKGKYWCYVEVDGLLGYMATDYLTSER